MEVHAAKRTPADHAQTTLSSQVSGTYTCASCSVTYLLVVALPDTVEDADPLPPHFERLIDAIDQEHSKAHPTELFICRDGVNVESGFGQHYH